MSHCSFDHLATLTDTGQELFAVENNNVTAMPHMCAGFINNFTQRKKDRVEMPEPGVHMVQVGEPQAAGFPMSDQDLSALNGEVTGYFF